jgi:hypothetical protein
MARATSLATGWRGWLGSIGRRAAPSAIEVGLQNGGMASGLAGAMGKLATMGLAAAVLQPVDEHLRILAWRTTGAGGAAGQNAMLRVRNPSRSRCSPSRRSASAGVG